MPEDDLRDLAHLDRDLVRRLAAVGVHLAAHVLEHCVAPKDRRRLAERAEVDPDVLSRLVKLVELTRVHGIRVRDAALLHEAGVRSLDRLQEADADRLAERMLAANEGRRLTRLVPPVPIIAGWIAEARRLETIVIESEKAGT